MGIKQWPAALRAAGISVREQNGFPGNDRGRPMPARPAGVFWHHDASPPGNSPGSLSWITNAYNSGGPSAQIWVDRAGTWYFIGSGYASHAGVVRGNLTSANCIGIETDHTIEPMAPALLDSMRRGLAAVCKCEGRNGDFVTFHKIEASPYGRKIDPVFDYKNPNNTAAWPAELARERQIINGLIGGGSAPTPTPTPTPTPEDWFDMATRQDLDAALAAFARSDAFRGSVDDIVKQRLGVEFAQNNAEGLLNKEVMPRFAANFPKGVDVWIYEDEGGLWRYDVAAGESSHIPDPDTLEKTIAVLQQSGKNVKFWQAGDVKTSGAAGRRSAQDTRIPKA